MQVRFSGISEVRFYNRKKQNIGWELVHVEPRRKVQTEWDKQGGYFTGCWPGAWDRFFDLNDDGTRDKSAGLDLQKKMARKQAEAFATDNPTLRKKLLDQVTSMDNDFEQRIRELVRKFDAKPANEKTIQNIMVHFDRDNPDRVILEPLPQGDHVKF